MKNIVYYILFITFCIKFTYSVPAKIICNLYEYGECDLSRIIPEEHKSKKIYVKQRLDAKTKCEGYMQELDKSLKYLGNNLPMLVCLVNENNTYEHIATVEYEGITSAGINEPIKYGVIWRRETYLYLPSGKNPLELSKYSKLVLKNKDCTEKAISVASISKRKEIKGSHGKWSVSYVSDQRLLALVQDPVLCYCNYDTCMNDSMYDQKLCSVELEGPNLEQYIKTTCVIGIQCVIQIQGNYTVTKDYFIVSKTVTTPLSGVLTKKSEGVYHYYMNKDEYITDVKSETPMNIFWIPDGALGKLRVYVGSVKVLSVFMGNLYASFFGTQQLVFNNPNLLDCKNSYALIYREEIKQSTLQTKRDNSLLLKSKIEANSVTIDIEFSVSSLYTLKYCDLCDQRYLCKENDLYEDYSLLANLYLRGFEYRQNATCDLLNNCILNLNTLNMNQTSSLNSRLLISKKCGNADLLHFLEDNGLSQNEILRSSTKYKWITLNSSVPIYPLTVFKLCSCSKIFIKPEECDYKDYSIEVGSILNYDGKPVKNECWLGSNCEVLASGEHMKGSGKLTVSKSCNNYGSNFQNSYKLIEMLSFKSENGIKVLIRLEIKHDKSIVGSYNLCWKLKNELQQHSIGSIIIKKFELNLEKFYVPLGSSITIKPKEFVSGEHFLLLNQDCNQSGDAVQARKVITNTGLQMNKIIFNTRRKICWCVTNSSIRCNLIEHFKTEIGEILISGIMFNNEKFSCKQSSKCSVNLAFESYLNITSYDKNSFNAGSMLVIRKDDCNSPFFQSLVFIDSVYSTVPIIQSRTEDQFVVKYHTIYEKIVSSSVPIGEYNLCYKTESDDYFKVSKISIDGLILNKSEIMVYSGKRFNITITGHNLDKELNIFFSTTDKCYENSEKYSNVSTLIPTTASLIYKDNGRDVMMWTGVIVKRNHMNSQMTFHDISRANSFNISQKLYLCYMCNGTARYTGVDYLISAPKLIVESDLNGKGALKTILDSRWHISKINMLLITFLSAPVSTVLCENNNLNQYSDNVKYLFYSSNRLMVELPKYLEIRNSLICWCGGTDCNAISDYATTLLFPSFNGLNIEVFELSDEPIKLKFIGYGLTPFDEIRFVDYRTECGDSSSSIMTTNINVDTPKKPSATGIMTIAERNSLGLIKKFSFNHNKSVWESYPLKLKKHEISNNLRYKVCLCSFLVGEQCKIGADFMDTTGLVVASDPKRIKNKLYIIRVFITYSHTDEKVIKICSRKNVDSLHTVTYSFRMKGEVSDARAFVEQFVSRYSKNEGFMLESCLIDHDPVKIDHENYIRFIVENKKGIYTMQKITIMAKVPQDIAIRANDISESDLYNMGIISSELNCSESDKNNIHLVESSKIENNNLILFEKIVMDQYGTYKICVKKVTNSNSRDIDSEWFNIGFLKVKEYYLNYVSDLISFNPLELDDKGVVVPGAEQKCSLEGYTSLVQLCVILRHQIIILSDCNNKLWAVEFSTTNGVVNVLKDKSMMSLNYETDEPEKNWYLCKEIPHEDSLVFLGEKFMLSVRLPLDKANLDIIKVFKHNIVNPLDVTMFNMSFLISDGYTRSLYYYYPPVDAVETLNKKKILRGYYCISLHLIVEDDHLEASSRLVCLEPEINSIIMFNYEQVVNQSGSSVITTYDVISGENLVTIGSLDRPCAMDSFITSFLEQDYVLLFVAENVTGRIIVFKIENNVIFGYKIMYSRGLISKIRVDSNSKIIYISSWRNHLGRMEQFVQNKPIYSYLHLKFYYNLLEKYQSGDEIELEPTVKGDYFEFFHEKTLENQNNQQIVNLTSVGLSLDIKTGKITGKININGTYYINIYGGNLLKEVKTTIKISASCPPTQQFSKVFRICEDCPVGTYRNDEAEDLCMPCSSKKPNSTTKQQGSRYFLDCLCESGHYLKGDECVKCEYGTWKGEIGDSACSGTCGSNMTSDVSGAKSLEELNCYCLPRFYNMRNSNLDDEFVPPDILNLAGISAHIGIKYRDIDPALVFCIPCNVGFYCPGGESSPKFCGVGKSTRGKYSSSEDECECDKGYGSTLKGCEPCSQFGYKDSVGNTPCNYCHEHSVKKDLRLLRLHSDLFRFNPEAMRRNANRADSGIVELFLEHLKMFKTQTNGAILVTNKLGSTTVSECKYCISGYYFDNNAKDCFVCPYGSFCSGFDNQPKRCGLNSILSSDNALSSMSCMCPMRYGNASGSRNPINLSVECHQCPVGYFQHLELTDISCLPCPENSTTTSVGSNSILSCIPEPGSFIHALLKVPISLILETEDKIKEETFESNYIKLREKSDPIKKECAEVRESFVSSRFTTEVLRETETSCSQECLRNIYCTGYTFNNSSYYLLNENTHYITNEVYLFDGTGFINVKFKTCKLYFFNLDIIENQDAGESTDIIKLCKVIYDFPFESMLCPTNNYCAGTRIPTPCHKNSVTLGIGARSIESCLCIAGYEPSTQVKGQCMPCNIGWYKEEIGNVACKRCPEKFKTFHSGSKHSTDCACTQGYYAVPENKHDVININDEYIVTDKLIFKQGEKIEVDMDIKIDDYNRFDYIVDHRYRILLSDSMVFIPSGASSKSIQKSNTYKIRCEKCLYDHYCPGGWFGYMDSDYENTVKMDINQYKIHNIPYRCPTGSGIPMQATNPSSLSHCLCLPGYMPLGSETLQNSSEELYDSVDHYFTSIMSLVIKRTYSNRCVPCETGMFKEGQENSTCSGRCMEYATTYGGSVSESQCFCHYGRYMKMKYSAETKLATETIREDYRNLKCSKCMEGAICPGGLDIQIVQNLKQKYDYQQIRLEDHVKPMPKQGYFPAYPSYNNIETISETWSPGTQNVSIAEKVNTDYVEFHPCSIEFRCGGGFTGYCSKGSSGYLCCKCVKNYDTVHFRSICAECQSLIMEISKYFMYRLPLCLIVFLIFIILHYNLEECCVLLKIFIEFYFTMVPYGVISVFTKSSLKQFVHVYNNTFSHSLTSFTYIRIGCIHRIVDPNSYVNIWYVQRFVSTVAPLIDSLFLLLFFFILKSSISLTKMIVYTRCDSHKQRVGDSRRNSTNRIQDINYKPLFLKILIISYFIQIHFIWIELFQMIWCVSVKYKKQPGILVMLHMPSEMCSADNNKFVITATASSFIILVSLILFLIFIVRFNSHEYGMFFGLGYRKHYKGWDCVSLIRRLMISIITTFHITIHSPYKSGRLRVITSLMLSCLIGVVYLGNSPFNFRNDNLFNRLQILGICVNIATAFMIQGSFSYDFNYATLAPIFLFGGFCVVLIWYTLVEIGRISKLDNVRRKDFKSFREWFWNLVSKSLQFFTYWHTEAQITYNIRNKCITIESPFDLDYEISKAKRIKYRYHKGKNSRLNRSGRNKVALSVHQSMNKLILERNTLSVPSHWISFIINYTMTKFDSINRVGRYKVTDIEEMVITPWLISKFTLEASDEDFEVNLKHFDPERPNLLKEAELKYGNTKEIMFQKIIENVGNENNFNEEMLDEMIEMTHMKGILEERLQKLNQELEKLIENAKQGEEAVQYVISIQEGVKNVVDTPLTNEEILMKIEQSISKQNKTKDNI